MSVSTAIILAHCHHCLILAFFVCCSALVYVCRTMLGPLVLSPGTAYAYAQHARGQNAGGGMDNLLEAFTGSLDGAECYLLAWAMVYNKVQGCTVEGTVCLHDMASRYMRRSALYVGLSRATEGGNVFIARE